MTRASVAIRRQPLWRYSMLRQVSRDGPVLVKGTVYSSRRQLFDALFKQAGMNCHTLYIEDTPDGPIVFVNDILPVLDNPEAIISVGDHMGLGGYIRVFQGEL
jgi:hypothetical protein